MPEDRPGLSLLFKPKPPERADGPAEEEATSDVAFNDAASEAFEAVKAGDERAFARALRNALEIVS